MSRKNPNAADEQQVAKATKRQKRQGDRYDEDFRWLMSQERGRRLMWSWLGECGVYQTSFTGNSTTFFNEGQRNVGLKRLGDIHRLCADEYVRMLKESQADELED